MHNKYTQIISGHKSTYKYFIQKKKYFFTINTILM